MPQFNFFTYLSLCSYTLFSFLFFFSFFKFSLLPSYFEISFYSFLFNPTSKVSCHFYSYIF